MNGFGDEKSQYISNRKQIAYTSLKVWESKMAA